jgi:hypothetical protein
MEKIGQGLGGSFRESYFALYSVHQLKLYFICHISFAMALAAADVVSSKEDHL